MASVFGHGLMGYTIAKVGNSKSMRWVMPLAIISAMLPDLDVISFQLGIPYESVFGHRGFSHSILFAALWALLLSLFWKSNRWLVFFILFLSTVSHGLIDALTNGGKGIALFAPISNQRIFFPWHPIQVSPLGISRFFSEWGLRVIESELLYIGIPCIILLVLSKYFKIE